MTCNALLLSFTIAISLVVPTHAGPIDRYAALGQVQNAAIAPLPQGGFAVGVVGESHAVITIDHKGQVTAGRALGGHRLIFLTTTPAGEIYVGSRPPRGMAREDDFLRVMKLHPDLSVDWTRRVVPDRPGFFAFPRAAGTRDGGVVLAGWLGAGAIVCKLTGRGDHEWTTQIDASGQERINAIAQASDGGYVAVGNSPRFPWLLRLDKRGALVWQRAYGPSEGILQSVVETDDGGFVAAGNRSNKPIALKFNDRGEISWTREATDPGYGYSVAATEGGAIATMVLGPSESGYTAIAFAHDGSIRWQTGFRPGAHSVLANAWENAMLATSGRTALAVASSRPLMVVTLEAQRGVAYCPWVSASQAQLSAATLREEPAGVEVSAPKLTTTAVDASPLQPLAAASSAEDCVSTLPEWAAPPPAPERKTLPFRSADDVAAQKKAYAELLLSKNFEQLDETGDRLRRERPSRDPMRPNLALITFYEAFAANEAAPVETRLARLREWVKARPQSITARVALAWGLNRAAWAARGSGYADTVTETGAQTYSVLNDEMKDVLDRMGATGEVDPAYWMLRFGLARESGHGDVRQLGLKALALHPDPEVAFAAAGFFYPKWGGSEEMFVKFADEVSRATSAVYGDAVYMWLAYQTNDYKDYPFDWARIKKGAEDLIRLKPEWLPSYHRFAVLADRYGDRETLRSLFQRPELEWYEDANRMWLDRERYERVRRRALQPQGSPSLKPPTP